MPPMYWRVPALAAHMLAHLAAHAAGQVEPLAPLPQQLCSGDEAFQPTATHGPRSPLH